MRFDFIAFGTLNVLIMGAIALVTGQQSPLITGIFALMLTILWITGLTQVLGYHNKGYVIDVVLGRKESFTTLVIRMRAAIGIAWIIWAGFVLVSRGLSVGDRAVCDPGWLVAISAVIAALTVRFIVMNRQNNQFYELARIACHGKKR